MWRGMLPQRLSYYFSHENKPLGNYVRIESISSAIKTKSEIIYDQFGSSTFKRRNNELAQASSEFKRDNFAFRKHCFFCANVTAYIRSSKSIINKVTAILVIRRPS